jgi:FixJ family two-component response regulator
MMPEAKPTVFVVDDDEAVRESLVSLIRSAGLSVEAFASAQQFLDFSQSDDSIGQTTLNAPRCLVLDLRMPGMNGIDLQQRMAEINFELPIIFITGHGDVPTSVRAMKAGAVEFLTKPFDDQDLLAAIGEALERDRIARRRQEETAELRARYGSLTTREREVMGLVISGLLNKQIAAELGISDVTVKIHRGQVMKKMRAKSLADLVRMSEKLGNPQAT